MCGIVGVAGDLQVKHERMFGDLLVMNQLRGFDSIGVTKVGVERQPVVLKTLEDPATLLGSIEYKDILAGANRLLLGHNRAATVGDVNVMNAHPFIHGHITGVHNGTVGYRRDLEEHERFLVDSDNIYYHIYKKGIKDLWVKLWGAASLVWWDAALGKLNFLRNKDRPMYLAMDKDRKVLIWGSEFYMIYAAASRNGITLSAPPMATKVDKLYSFDLFNNYKRGDVLKPVEEDIDTKPVYKYTYTPANSTVHMEGCPAWLKIGHTIDCLFDSMTKVNSFLQFDGWSPLDDRINISVSYVDSEGMVPVVNLDKKTQIYRGNVNRITRVYRQGTLEFDVKVVGVHLAVSKDGVPLELDSVTDSKAKNKDVEALLGEIVDDIDAEGDDYVPFDEADARCSVNCTLKKKKMCKRCRLAFHNNRGTWTYNHGKRYFCDWCGGVHGQYEAVYVTGDKEESYCKECFPTVVNHLATRDLIN